MFLVELKDYTITSLEGEEEQILHNVKLAGQHFKLKFIKPVLQMHSNNLPQYHVQKSNSVCLYMALSTVRMSVSVFRPPPGIHGTGRWPRRLAHG